MFSMLQASFASDRGEGGEKKAGAFMAGYNFKFQMSLSECSARILPVCIV